MSRSRVLVVVSDTGDAEGVSEDRVIPASRYLEGRDGSAAADVLVVNLCRSARYGGDGYYVSLLADARGQRVLPSLETRAGLAEPYACFRALQEAGVPTVDAAEMAVRRREAGVRARPPVGQRARPSAPFPAPHVREPDGRSRLARSDEYGEAVLCLGRSDDPRLRHIARAVFRVWPAPLLRLQVVREDDVWKVTRLAAASPHHLSAPDRRRLAEALSERPGAIHKRLAGGRESVRASIAVLVDPEDPFSPSSPETVDRLERVASRMNVHLARIGTSELRRLPEYDALFIRTLTGVREPAFQFALRAEALDMPVLDDSQSILRCGNKVFLEELLRREGVPTPETRIITPHTPWEAVESLGLPFVIKLPDGSFSTAVHKIGSRKEFRERSGEMFRHSPLIIAQRWVPTEFDWRVTVLDGRVLFVARYFMARGHWQIRSANGAGAGRFGRVEAVPRGTAPPAILATALAAASLIGSGLYGVDLKETPDGPLVIEVNDNPNLDLGYEDAADGNEIYEGLLQYFLSRIEEVGPHGWNGRGAAAASPEDAAPAPVARRFRDYGAFEVAGIELEYPTVDRELDVVALVEPAFRTLAGRGVSEIELEGAGFSNEIADHVLEVKTPEPVRSLVDAEGRLQHGIEGFLHLLGREFDARLLPTGMHPWFDPLAARLWTRSGLRIYTTYAWLFDLRTHGWMNVHATHLNLPFGSDREAVALHTAASLVIPYLPALTASSPVYDGRLAPDADARLRWLLEHQSRIPETCGRLVPEYVCSLQDYRRRILQPMYSALDRFPHSSPLRREFLNARGAVLRFGRRALELRVLDTQECVKVDVAVAAFARAALKALAADVLAARVTLPPHEALVGDFEACIRDAESARVSAPHFPLERDARGSATARSALLHVLERAWQAAPAEDGGYLELVRRIIETGSLATRIRAALAGLDAGGPAWERALRQVYGELADCLAANQPWRGRGL